MFDEASQDLCRAVYAATQAFSRCVIMRRANAQRAGRFDGTASLRLRVFE
jgi:hypothetical protein